MEKSETIGAVAKALVKAQKEMSNAKKGAKNPFFKSNYADLNSIREAIMPVLNDNGISALQPSVVVEGKPYIQTILLHESGEFISGLTEVICNKANDAQSHGSGISYARRYGLQSIINIGAEDDDGNAATKPTQKAAPVAKAEDDLKGVIEKVREKVLSYLNDPKNEVYKETCLAHYKKDVPGMLSDEQIKAINTSINKQTK